MAILSPEVKSLTNLGNDSLNDEGMTAVLKNYSIIQIDINTYIIYCLDIVIEIVEAHQDPKWIKQLSR